jgi:hypothetical protein
MGFVPYVGYRQAVGRVERFLRFPQVAWLREFRVHTRQSVTHDLTGFREGQVAHLHGNIELENGTVISPAINWEVEGLSVPFRIPGTTIRVPAGTYEGFNAFSTFNTNSAAPVSFNGRVEGGNFLSGNIRAGSLGVSVRQGGTLTGNVNVSHNRIRLPEGHFNTTLTRLRLRYAFSPALSLQSAVQYSDQSGLWTGQLRFGWLDTAGTGLFIVYNERQTMDIAGMTGLFPRHGLEIPERTVAVKFTRQFDVARLAHGLGN